MCTDSGRESTDFPDNLFPIISSGNATSVANILIRILPAAFQLLPDFSVAHDPELLTEEPTLEEVDGKQVNVYSINPDAVWSDGTAITADDFSFTAKVQDTEFTEVCPDGGILGTTRTTPRCARPSPRIGPSMRAFRPVAATAAGRVRPVDSRGCADSRRPRPAASRRTGSGPRHQDSAGT